MNCSFCGHADTRVVDSRLISGGIQIRRRRLCGECGERLTTIESVSYSLPRVVKQTGEREVFSEEKLRTGVIRALDKRAVSAEDVEAMFASLVAEISRLGEREITSTRLGEMVMDKLKALDPVAYVRFASVYRCFQDVSDFREAIEGLNPNQVNTGAGDVKPQQDTVEVQRSDYVHGTC